MAVIQRDCPFASVCILRRKTVRVSQEGGRQVALSFKTVIVHGKLEYNGFNLAFKGWNGEILQPLFSAPPS